MAEIKWTTSISLSMIPTSYREKPFQQQGLLVTRPLSYHDLRRAGGPGVDFWLQAAQTTAWAPLAMVPAMLSHPV